MYKIINYHKYLIFTKTLSICMINLNFTYISAIWVYVAVKKRREIEFRKTGISSLGRGPRRWLFLIGLYGSARFSLITQGKKNQETLIC